MKPSSEIFRVRHEICQESFFLITLRLTNSRLSHSSPIAYGSQQHVSGAIADRMVSEQEKCCRSQRPRHRGYLEMQIAEAPFSMPAESQSPEPYSYQAALRFSGCQPVLYFRSLIPATP